VAEMSLSISVTGRPSAVSLERSRGGGPDPLGRRIPGRSDGTEPSRRSFERSRHTLERRL